MLDRTPLDELLARRKGLYLHRTSQHRETSTNSHALNGIRTSDLNIQARKAFASDGVVTGSSLVYI
jgi:hypothetical protein